ncbi:MAG TPA: glycosyltransferase family 4 protein [Solirubrobacteraceae bacterium]|jgi:glycosyltransferase involved in cell wall biosynthesis|nr:glycosyltransferase family 4 protein [Solirubrobacteraceae bacterium]
MTQSSEPDVASGPNAASEPGAASERAPHALDAEWRAQAERAQEATLPHGRVTVSCPARLDAGGLGRHLRELLDALARAGQPATAIHKGSDALAAAARPPGARARHALDRAIAPALRGSLAWRMWAQSVEFDADAARALGERSEGDRAGSAGSAGSEHLIAFNGTAIAQFRAAERAGWGSLTLVAANSHYRHLVRQHELAHSQYPIERPWPRHLLRRNLAEYACADRIHVASRYIRDSFLAEGFPEAKLLCFPLTPHPRFAPPGAGAHTNSPADTSSGASTASPSHDTFDVVYVGSLSVHKGVPLLIDAIGRLPQQDLRLVLVGGWGTRAMRRFLERAVAADPRISVAPGDPAPVLADARLCVHAAYEDGFAYAPAEALACGVPVIVSEDTGMKELVDPGRSGLIVPTGDRDALSEAIAGVYRGELLDG